MNKLVWNQVDWTLVQQRVFRLQRRIYKASAEREIDPTVGNDKVHAL